MVDSSFRRMRRVANCLAEPSGWRSLRTVSRYNVAHRNAQPVMPQLEVKRLIPATCSPSPGIPSIVFQTWKSRSAIPQNYRYWRQTFVDLNPQAQIVLWDDADNRAFIAESFGWFLPIYDAYPREIFRADAVRYFFLFAFGGLYADMDSECLRPLDLEHRTEDVVLGRMGPDQGFEHSIPNALMASRPGQAFWLLVIQRMRDMALSETTRGAQDAAGPEVLTGPVLLKRSYDEYVSLDPGQLAARIAPVVDLLDPEQRQTVRAGKVTILDRNAWYPLDWTNPFHKQLRNHLNRESLLLPADTVRWIFPHAELVTYWSHSW